MRSDKKGPDAERMEQSEELNYVPSVSFDTVPLLAGIACESGDENHDCHDHTLEYTEDEFYDDETPADYSGYPNHDRRTVIDSTINGLDGFHIGWDGRITRTDYPSRPTIVNDALVLSKVHKTWLARWRSRQACMESRLRSGTTHFVFPALITPMESNAKPSGTSGYTPLTKEERRRALIIGKKVGFPNSPRTIVCHISGRKYTWTALDWLLKQFSQDVDHLVIIANIPKMSGSGSRSRSRSRSAIRRSRPIASSRRLSATSETMYRTFSAEPADEQNRQKHEEWLEWASGYDAGRIKEVLNNILKYVTCVLPENRAVKVTVEIVLGKTKKILVDSINVYHPDLMVLSSVRSGETESMVKWKSRSLVDKACQTFPVPVVLVPVKTLLELERDVKDQLEMQIAAKSAESSNHMPQLHHANTAPGILNHTGTPDPSSSAGPRTEGSSTSSIDSEDTGIDSSVSLINNNALSANTRLRDDLMTLRKETKAKTEAMKENNSLTSDQQLIASVDVIFDATLKFADLLDALNQSTESLVELKREFTGNASKEMARSRKSMLDVVGSPKVSKLNQQKKGTPLKGQIKLPATGADPSDSIVANGGNNAVPKIQIKFAPEVKDKDGTASAERNAIERTFSYDATLRSHSSNSIENSLRDTDLRKVRSASVLKPTKSATSVSSDIKKKSKGLFSFLGGFDSGSGSTGSTPSTSRRNSIGSEASGIILNAPKKKKRSRFFGLRKS
ncbi:LAME_0H10638g1_1 [Lachancea meyersii CBS 8951]|uniref:LAME_0H10638g1_1 n=1 Tax=Lachancea meyersii CBS 8951 TaxID=1266667 RepID=A0A1G4KGD6_9SACH|nr:LAME_0H10638g1_1 [Lachancea meyersii CBS 8951]